MICPVTMSPAKCETCNWYDYVDGCTYPTNEDLRQQIIQLNKKITRLYDRIREHECKGHKSVRY